MNIRKKIRLFFRNFNPTYLSEVYNKKDIVNKGDQQILPIEIEQCILTHEDVKQTVVFPVPHPVFGEDIMAAVVLNKDKKFDEYKLKNFITTLVPAHKIPAKIISIKEIPLTENGAIIRKDFSSLFRQEIKDSLFTLKDQTPLTIEEQFVFKHVSKILNLKAPNIEQDFFSLGGSSLDLLELITSISFELGVQIDGVEFMQASDIKSFANYLKTNHAEYFSNKMEEHKTSLLKNESQSDLKKTILKEKSEHNSEHIRLSNILKFQRKLVCQWGGFRLDKESLIIGKNTNGLKKPLFWCFQSYQEFDIMAEYLGIEQPLFGMRSGHLIFKMNEVENSGIPEQYAKEIIALKPDGPYIIGGNCQGAMVAWHLAHELLRLGKEVELLFLMEINLKKKYDYKIALLYGEDSKNINPYLSESNPDETWQKIYPSYSVDIITGAHGEYFEKENIGDFSQKIIKRLSLCLA